VTRLGDRTTRSDDAPADAAFLVGGSLAFGIGASDDAGTLAAALWRRTGVPYVNLGVRAANSTQELIAALPFADRETTFVVCSGLNNLVCTGLNEAVPGVGRGLDPVFGPMFDERPLRTLAAYPISRLARMVRDPLEGRDIDELRRELRARRKDRRRDRLRPVRRLRKRAFGLLGRGRPPSATVPLGPGPPQAGPELEEVVAEAAARQLRDLRLLRRMVPDEARVVFALQPVAWSMDKSWSEEERELFEVLDLFQRKRLVRLKGLLETAWPSYGEALERGCGLLGVPFVDLAHADYTGWCFVDRVHMTDRGYEAAAALTAEVLTGAAA
jgi:hypothetical protein